MVRSSDYFDDIDQLFVAIAVVASSEVWGVNEKECLDRNFADAGDAGTVVQTFDQSCS